MTEETNSAPGSGDARSPDKSTAVPAGASGDGRRRDDLPIQVSSFVGRKREIAGVEELLAAHRLVTLTGPGGSGKTRLALAVASEAAQDFRDGAWLVELASLSDPDLVPQSVASVLGVRETPGTPLVDTLSLHLGPSEALLVLDNCEHLVGACAGLAGTLLRSCPKRASWPPADRRWASPARRSSTSLRSRCRTRTVPRTRRTWRATRPPSSSSSGRGHSGPTSRSPGEMRRRWPGSATCSTGYRSPSS